VKGLNGINLGGRPVVCRRANVRVPSLTATAPTTIPGLNLDALAPNVEVITIPPPSRIVIFQNLTSVDELKREYETIVEDVKAECTKYGVVKSILGHEGRVFVEFDELDPAVHAASMLLGRSYNQHTVITGFLAESDWNKKEYDASW